MVKVEACGRNGHAACPISRAAILRWRPLAIPPHNSDDIVAAESPSTLPSLPLSSLESVVDEAVAHVNASRLALQGCVFTRDIDAAIAISDAMATGTVQINAAPARGPDHFPFQGFRDSGIGSQASWVPAAVSLLGMPGRLGEHRLAGKQHPHPRTYARTWRQCARPLQSYAIHCPPTLSLQGVRNSLALMCKTKTTVINLPKPSYTQG